MKITSLEIKQHEFERSFRGYNADEVNQFLGNLAQEWDKMLNELKMLKMQLDIAEKEASKLREVEMTLIKTLRTAEDTSSKITENATAEASKKIQDANFEARKTIEDANASAKKTLDSSSYEATKNLEEANQKASQILKEAENASKQMIAEAENKVKEIQSAAETEIADLDTRYNALDGKRKTLIEQLKAYNQELAKLIGSPDDIVETASEPQESEKTQISKVKLEVVNEEKKSIDFYEETRVAEEDYSNGISLPSAVNAINLESSADDKTNLEIIEGIGPKIKEVLNNAGIKDFRTLAITPEYRLRDILSAAGSHFMAHDPSSWNEQALLAENGQWEKLEDLKSHLIAGRTPKEEEQESTSSNVDGSNTEEMLDKVNKVKAAIRKAMIEKSESPAENTTEKKNQSGSFFDSI